MPRNGFDDWEGMKKDAERLGKAVAVAGSAKMASAKMALAALAALGIGAAVAHGAGKGGEAKADSLRLLRIIISSEVHPEDTLLVTKRPRLTDSLLANPAPLNAFMRSIRDTASFQRLDNAAEFERYWKQLERTTGIKTLQGQMHARDADRSRVPKAYLFDSTVVVLPGWIILRRIRR